MEKYLKSNQVKNIVAKILVNEIALQLDKLIEISSNFWIQSLTAKNFLKRIDFNYNKVTKMINIDGYKWANIDE